MSRKLFIICLFLIGSFGSSYALSQKNNLINQFERLVLEEEWAEAHKLVSKQKSPETLFLEGVLYFDNSNPHKDIQKGIELLEQAYSLGKNEAAVVLTAKYIWSKNETYLNYSRADQLAKEVTPWLISDFNNGNTKSGNTLGGFYLTGLGVKKNIETAYNYYRKSADLGDVKAQEQQATMLVLGLGVEKNIGKAMALLNDLMSRGIDVSKKISFLENQTKRDKLD